MGQEAVPCPFYAYQEDLMRVFFAAFTCFFLLLACGCGGEENKTDPRNVNADKEAKKPGTRSPESQNVTSRGD
jgi:hypothetical protein